MTTALLACETVILVLLSILVVGLLRSHAEILRRLGEGAAEATPRSAPAEPREAPPAVDVRGETLDGDAVQLGLGAGRDSTLVAFLSSGCSICEGFWDAFQPGLREPLPGGARLLIVVRDPSEERPARLRELSPPDVPLVMSSQAWADYRVPTTPYFVYVDGRSGRIHGEGSAAGWQQVSSLLADALDDIAAHAGNGSGSRRGGAERARRAERELGVAGIGPGHPSLYPGEAGGGE